VPHPSFPDPRSVPWEDAEIPTPYAGCLEETGVKAYAATPGNLEVRMLHRTQGERTEFLMFSLWESMDAIRAFAGDDVETAVFYPQDDRFLIERDLTATHWEVG
jgi:heme-degrading monooxygenase HmoA